ncbi:MAG: thiamine pyrophosphate-dependent dehydrogenase E1 component subunit alpha [bacterium]|jgi:TPP-dependent pyruvate/acetoin dehydrogenase alpha subunit
MAKKDSAASVVANKPDVIAGAPNGTTATLANPHRQFIPGAPRSKFAAKDFTREERADIEKIYRYIRLTRETDDRLRKLFRQGKFYGTYFAAVGMEATVVVPAFFCEPMDFVGITHRELGCFLTKGMPLRMVFAQIFSRECSEEQAKTPPFFWGWTPARILRHSSVLASQIPLSVGAALAYKMQGVGGAALCYFGEGSAAKGDFHESLNFAGVHKLPIVFVCINNWYAESLPINLSTPVEDISIRAKGYGFEGVRVDGNDTPLLYKTFKEAFRRARAGEGPTLVQCDTYRWYGHSEIDPATYRPSEEVEKWIREDPVLRIERWLLRQDWMNERDFERIKEECLAEIDEAIEWALSKNEPDAEVCLTGLYAESDGEYLNKE